MDPPNHKAILLEDESQREREREGKHSRGVSSQRRGGGGKKMQRSEGLLMRGTQDVDLVGQELEVYTPNKLL